MDRKTRRSRASPTSRSSCRMGVPDSNHRHGHDHVFKRTNVRAAKRIGDEYATPNLDLERCSCMLVGKVGTALRSTVAPQEESVLWVENNQNTTAQKFETHLVTLYLLFWAKQDL